MFQGRQYCFVEGTGTLKSDRPGFEFELCQSLTLRPSASSFMSQAHFPHPSNEGLCSVAKLCLTLCNPTGCSTPGLCVIHYLPEFAEIHVHWVSDAIKPSRPLPPFSPSVFPSIRVFFNELALCIRWPKYWSFCFSISPSNENSMKHTHTHTHTHTYLNVLRKIKLKVLMRMWRKWNTYILLLGM